MSDENEEFLSLTSNESLEYISDVDASEIDIEQNELHLKVQQSKLSKIESIYLACSLEDGIRQMMILLACNKNLKTKIHEEKSHNLPTDRLEKVNYADLASDNHKIAKMNSDRMYVMNMLIKIHLDLYRNKSFASLLMELSDIATKTYQSVSQELRHNENRSVLKDLQEQINSEMCLNKCTLQNCDMQIHTLQDEIADAKCNWKIKTEYVTSWQNSQIHQQKLKNSEDENSITESLVNMKTKIEQESKVNQEIEKYMHIKTNELSDKIIFWKEKYTSESKEIDDNISELKKLRETQNNNMVALQKLLEDHKRDIDNWLTFVEERNKKLERERLVQRSAVMLQAWWRGMLVRRRLAAKLAKDSKRKSAKKKK